MSIEFDFSGKRVFVTGSTYGIGRSAAEAFHALGATVAINGRAAGLVRRAIDEIGSGPRLVSAPGDVADSSSRQAVVERALEVMGGLDILVNNAGRGDDCPIDDVTEEFWQRMLALNLKGAFFVAQACVPALRQTKGCIINVASALGLMGGPPGTVVYAITKGALVQMTRMMALALARDGVRVNALCPGWIDTPMIQKDNERAGGNALYDYIVQSTPLGRIGTAAECAAAILYLAAPFSGFTTGAILSVDGGLVSGH
jgi:NAD(P)-dependent dehydrogenase (short-subunit alcohol dehydrogenase family)